MPTDIQGLARKAYRLFASNPQHRSLRFTAVAVAADAVLLNATDSDWGEQATLMQTLGVTVDQLCPQHAFKAKRWHQ